MEHVPAAGAAAHDHAVLYCFVAIPENGLVSDSEFSGPPNIQFDGAIGTAYQTSHVKAPTQTPRSTTVPSEACEVNECTSRFA